MVFDQLHVSSFLIGNGVVAVVITIILLIAYNRIQRNRLLLTLRLEQTEQDRQRLRDEASQLRSEQETLQLQNRQLERDNIGLEAFLHETRAISKEGPVIQAMCRMWVNKSVPATAGARLVVSDRGDILSPK